MSGISIKVEPSLVPFFINFINWQKAVSKTKTLYIRILLFKQISVWAQKKRKENRQSMNVKLRSTD